MQIEIQPMTNSHLDAIWTIEQNSHSHPWKASMIQDLNSRGQRHHTLLCNGQVAGYYYAQNIVGEVTLLNIAVDTKYQGKGLGKQLLQHLIDTSENQKAESIWLEVRESNARAIILYRSMGFNELDRRKNYYPTESAREDALIMNYSISFNFF